MTKANQRYLTLEPENQFSFTCPVFDADTQMRQCMALREAVWMGKYVEKRQGCQAAMRCGMCPAAAIVSKIIYAQSHVSDDYGSLEPKKGRLHADILNRVLNVIPVASWVGRYNLTEREYSLLHTARQRVAEQLKTAPGSDGKKAAFVEPRKYKAMSLRNVSQPLDGDSTPVREKTKPESAIGKAAATGDLAAALNAA